MIQRHGHWMLHGVGDARREMCREGKEHPPDEMVPERKLESMLITSPAHSVSKDADRRERMGAENVRDFVEQTAACSM